MNTLAEIELIGVFLVSVRVGIKKPKSNLKVRFDFGFKIFETQSQPKIFGLVLFVFCVSYFKKLI